MLFFQIQILRFHIKMYKLFPCIPVCRGRGVVVAGGGGCFWSKSVKKFVCVVGLKKSH